MITYVYVCCVSRCVWSVSGCACQCDCELACLPVSLCVCLTLCVNVGADFCVRLCVSVHLWVPSHGPQVFVHPHCHPPCSAPWLQELGRIWGHGLAQAWGWGQLAVGEEGGLGGGPYSAHSRQKQGGQGSPSSHPSDLCVRCLPAHPRGAASDAASLPGPPQGQGPRSQGPDSSQLSRAVKDLLTSSNMLGPMGQTDCLLGLGAWWRVSGNHCVCVEVNRCMFVRIWIICLPITSAQAYTCSCGSVLDLDLCMGAWCVLCMSVCVEVSIVYACL